MFIQVVQYLADCGLQSCSMLVAKGYTDIGWNPVEAERYLDFLRFAVFCNGTLAQLEHSFTLLIVMNGDRGNSHSKYKELLKKIQNPNLGQKWADSIDSTQKGWIIGLTQYIGPGFQPTTWIEENHN